MTLKGLVRRFARSLIIRLGIQIHNVNSDIAQATLPKFGNNPKNLRIDLPRRIINAERIFLGDNIFLGPGSFLFAMTHYPTVSMQHPERKQVVQKFDSKITIGNNVTATAGLQIAAHNEVVIEDDVMFASNIYVNDGFHGYHNANEPYKYQPMFKIGPITIKKGSWIGQNAVIMPGVMIGNFSIVGANSVVTKNVPDMCIVAGNPAKVIKKWDIVKQRWFSVTIDDDEIENQNHFPFYKNQVNKT